MTDQMDREDVHIMLEQLERRAAELTRELGNVNYTLREKRRELEMLGAMLDARVHEQTRELKEANQDAETCQCDWVQVAMLEYILDRGGDRAQQDHCSEQTEQGEGRRVRRRKSFICSLCEIGCVVESWIHADVIRILRTTKRVRPIVVIFQE